MSIYTLMLKDTPIANIKLHESNANICKIYNQELLPLGLISGYYTMKSWIESRYTFVNRQESPDVFSTLGINGIDHFISITNCASLNDCYWLKSEGSKKSWKSVSLYRNSFNEAISHYSFSGQLLDKNIGSSPDFSTDGSFPKCWIRSNNEISLVKTGTKGYFNAGYEPYSEVFTCQLAKHLGLPIINQTLVNYKGRESTKCNCICTENRSIIKLNELHNKPNTNFQWLVNQYPGNVFIQQLLMFDYLLCNIDRHFGNIWLYVNTDTNKVEGFTELCDNNLSCLPYHVPADESTESYINDVRAKDGNTWQQLLSLIKPKVVSTLAAKAQHFEFKPTGNSRADSRLPVVNTMLKYQLSQL